MTYPAPRSVPQGITVTRSMKGFELYDLDRAVDVEDQGLGWHSCFFPSSNLS